MLFHIAIFFLVKNSLISPCFAVLRTDPHNYLWTIKPARCVPTRCWGHYQKPLLILSDPPPLKSNVFHSPRGVLSINILKIYLNFIFILNPDIASWQFPPVKHIMKKSGFIELHVRENEPFTAFTPNYLKCGYIINRSYHKSFIHFQLYQGLASNVFAASPLI